MPTFCVYLGFNNSQNEKLKSIPTIENIQRWNERKLEYLQPLTCEALLNEVERFRRDGTFCSGTVESTISFNKQYLLSAVWFDALGIPPEYRSMNDIHLNENNISCKDNILEKWQSCLTGFTYKK